MSSSKLLASAVAATAYLLGMPAYAEVPLWRTVKSDFAEFRILADPLIVRDPKLTFILQDRLTYAESDVRSWDTYARQVLEEAEKTAPPATKKDAQATLHLLATINGHAAVLTASAECNGGHACISSEHVTIHRLSDRTKFEGAGALELSRRKLLNLLATQDAKRLISPAAITCDPSNTDADDSNETPCRPLAELLGFENNDDGKMPFASAKDVEDFARRIAGVGFSTDRGRIKTVDIYISASPRLPGHSRAYKWPIDVNFGAGLLKRAFVQGK